MSGYFICQDENVCEKPCKLLDFEGEFWKDGNHPKYCPLDGTPTAWAFIEKEDNEHNTEA